MRKDKFKEAMHCFKMENLHVPEGWKIMDPNYIDQKYQNLLTFHILPVTAMRETMQNIEKCNGECDKESTMQKCEKMSVKFSSQDYKLLVPFNPNKKTTTITTKTTKKQQTTVKQQTKTSKQEGNNTTTKGGNNPKIKKTTATKSSGISQATLLLVVSIIIL
ncbi:unnamed protein product [Meloidogyne enterolobii]|uniref:Uncharacterized protein n=1 Tax=Meloidogyne enterolobii TaxID=390850 RepID=A0ACB0ZGT2_MELEN